MALLRNVPAQFRQRVAVASQEQEQTVVASVQQHAGQHTSRPPADPAEDESQKSAGQEPLHGQQTADDDVERAEQEGRDEDGCQGENFLRNARTDIPGRKTPRTEPERRPATPESAGERDSANSAGVFPWPRRVPRSAGSAPAVCSAGRPRAPAARGSAPRSLRREKPAIRRCEAESLTQRHALNEHENERQQHEQGCRGQRGHDQSVSRGQGLPTSQRIRDQEVQREEQGQANMAADALDVLRGCRDRSSRSDQLASLP